MRGTVLVLSEELDPTVDAVVDELNRRGVDVLRCDTAWFPTRMSLDAQLTEDLWNGWLTTEHRRVALRDLWSAWYRRPTAFEFPEQLSGPERRHVMWEAKLGFGGVLANLPLLWVSHPSAEADCAYKPGQLVTAARCGLAVPPTLITNRADAVALFARAHRGQLVVKPLAYSSVFEENVNKALFTHQLTAAELGDLAGVDATAHLFQHAISEKAFEARLTVVGRSVFAAAIHTDSAAGRADWRSDYASLRLSVVEPPDAVTKGVLTFMDEFGLNFGAFDFAVDNIDGTWWFFECNSSGQFRFVEEATGLPITSALADLLEKGVA
jgi:ATP-grasp ribosomal peptide maturase